MTALPLTSRFQIVERPFAHPGKCAVCGATDRECVDFGMDLEDYGAVYFCVTCMTEAGLAVGLILPSVLEEATLEAGQSIDEYLAQTNSKVISNDLYGLLRSIVDHLPDDSSDSAVRSSNGAVDSLGKASGVIGEDAPVEQSDDLVGDSATVATSGQGTRSAGKRRSSSVPADTGYESLGLNI